MYKTRSYRKGLIIDGCYLRSVSLALLIALSLSDTDAMLTELVLAVLGSILDILRSREH